MKEEQLDHIKTLDKLILQHKRFPLLQEPLWKERTALLYALREQYGAFPKWTPYGYKLPEEILIYEDTGGEA